MEIATFLDLARELELKISELYRLASQSAIGGPLSSRLADISTEETNHANVLRVGKNYLIAAPDLFVGVSLNGGDIQDGLKQAETLSIELKEGLALREGLKRLLGLEKRFERIHLATSLELSDPSLKKLFSSLSTGDQNHIHLLTEMISGD